MAVTEFKQKLNELFDLLRKEGLIARQSFMCCQGCGFSALGTKVKEMKELKQKLPRGVVFFHKQDAEGLRESVPGVHLSYDTVEGSDINQLQVGQLVKKLAEQVGIKVNWNGTEVERPYLFPGPKVPTVEQRPEPAREAIVAKREAVEATKAAFTELDSNERPVVELIGRDGNAYGILATCERAAKKHGWPPEKVEAVMTEMKSGDYSNLIAVAQKYFEVI